MPFPRKMWHASAGPPPAAEQDVPGDLRGVKRAVTGRPIRVLVVDDDTDIGEMVRLALTDEGYEVVFVQNGAEALDASQSGPFDVILLDMRMPVMDGWAFAREYRARP